MKKFLQTEILKRGIPSILKTINGEKIDNKEDWEHVLRPYWKELLIQEEYGKRPILVSPQIQCIKKDIDFAGKAVWEEVLFTFEYMGKKHSIPTQLIIPKNIAKCPIFIYLNFRPNIPDRYLPVEEIVDNGFGIFTVCYQDITSDNRDFSNGLAGLFENGVREDNSTGKLMYWAYMASRMMDYLQTRSELNSEAVGIVGHSRLGKTALLAGALDERFSFVCANDSGCSGAALSRGYCVGAERIEDIYKKFDYWFCPNYAKYIANEQNMPFDQHCLLALLAPRAVYIGGAIEDVWADNDNQFLSCVAATEVWKLYGKKGLISSDRLPVCGDIFTDGEVGFHLRSGKHYHSRTDWLIYMDSVKKAFKLND